MGAQWKQAGREANAQKKGQMVVKLVREIMVAARLGGPDPELNARLAAAVDKARKAFQSKGARTRCGADRPAGPPLPALGVFDDFARYPELRIPRT